MSCHSCLLNWSHSKVDRWLLLCQLLTSVNIDLKHKTGHCTSTVKMFTLVISYMMVFIERCNDYLCGSESCLKNWLLKIISGIRSVVLILWSLGFCFIALDWQNLKVYFSVPTLLMELRAKVISRNQPNTSTCPELNSFPLSKLIIINTSHCFA